MKSVLNKLWRLLFFLLDNVLFKFEKKFIFVLVVFYLYIILLLGLIVVFLLKFINVLFEFIILYLIFWMCMDVLNGSWFLKRILILFFIFVWIIRGLIKFIGVKGLFLIWCFIWFLFFFSIYIMFSGLWLLKWFIIICIGIVIIWKCFIIK